MLVFIVFARGILSSISCSTLWCVCYTLFCNMVLRKFPSCSFREATVLWWTCTSWNQLTHPPVFPKSESWLSGLRRMACNSFALFLTLNPRIFIFLAPAPNTSIVLCCIYYFVTGNKFPYWSKKETLFNKLLVKINSPENLLLTCLTCSIQLAHCSQWEISDGNCSCAATIEHQPQNINNLGRLFSSSLDLPLLCSWNAVSYLCKG